MKQDIYWLLREKERKREERRVSIDTYNIHIDIFAHI
jgi:hypothetical protein